MRNDVSYGNGRPPRILVVIGAAFIVFQMWAYVLWGLADIPFTRALEPIPIKIAEAVEGAENIICAGAIIWLITLCVITLRSRRVTFPLFLTFGWSSAYWQESLVNSRAHAFSYNAHFLNRGDWIPYLPFWGSSKPLLNQPLLMEGLVFFWMIPVVCVCAYGLMHLLSRWTKSPAVLMVLAASSVIAFEAGFELSGINQQLLAWNYVPGSLSLWPGSPRQWPLPELLLGLVWSLPAIAWFYRGWPPIQWLNAGGAPANSTVTVMRVLALSALINIAFLSYNAVFAILELNSGANFPAWLGG